MIASVDRHDAIVVEQLNHAQWHAVLPCGGSTGVGCYVDALSVALDWSVLHRRPVETCAIDGTRHLVAAREPDCLAARGATWAR
jgi:hypothetical protein